MTTINQLKFNSKLSQEAIANMKLPIANSDCYISWHQWCKRITEVNTRQGKNLQSSFQTLIGLDEESWEWSCISLESNSIEEIESYHQELVQTGKIKFNHEGLDRAGYGRDGFNKNGFNSTAKVPTISEAGWGRIASEGGIAPLTGCEA